MLPIFFFELRYRLKRPATWIYSALFLVLGLVIMTTDAVRIGGGYGKVFSNAPYTLHQILSIFGGFGLFIIMAFMAVPIYRDAEHRMDTFLYAYPIGKREYLLGRFWGSFALCSFVFFSLALGMMAGEGIARMKAEDLSDWGPFRMKSYLWPYVSAVIPTVFFMGTLFFSLVTLTRKMMYAYIVAISFIVLYSVSLSLLSDLDNKTIAALLDPFGLTAAGRITEYWSIAEKNHRLVPLEGVFLWNRLFWSGIGCVFLVFSLIRFRMSPVADAPKAWKKKPEALPETMAVFPLPSGNWKPEYSGLRHFLSLWMLETRQNLRNGIFLALLFAIALYLSMDAWYADRSFDTGIHPVTGIMLETVTSSMFTILSIALLIFLAGEIVWRERQARMDGIYNAFPTSNGVVFASKFASLLLVPVFLIMLIPIVGMSIQTLKGYYHYEPELYFKTLLLFELPRLWLIAALAFAIQVIVNNKYAGNVAILGYYLGFIGLTYLKVEHPLFRYGSKLSYTYSDMNGFGDFVRPFRIYLLHWTLVAFFLLGVAYHFMVRGVESDFKARFRLAILRLKESYVNKGLIFVPFLAMLATGFYITWQTLEVDHYTNSKEDEKEMVAYEKQFGYLEESHHPSLKSVNVGADMFPENGDLKITGRFVYFNPHPKPLDTLWYNVNPEGRLNRFELSLPHSLVFEDKPKGIRAFRLKSPLAPGDSFQLNFEMALSFTGLINESPVKANGTFFNNQYWPSVGFNDNLRLSDEDKRRENGLPKTPPLPRQDDSLALQKSLFDSHNHSIRFEATLSTSPDQIAIAPGYLQKEWMQNGRRYFHYKMDRPITNFYSIISARYEVYKEKWNGIEIAIYHHPWHTFNVKRMAESVRHSLEYYTKNFGPYQHRQVRILEFPRYSSFAQSFDNTIPYSEAIGFIANLEEEDAVDYVYFVTAHEMAHQWWGHQIIPAMARGAQFLSETMAEYSALMVMKQRYGDELMGRFLRRELNGYLNGRSGEKEKENPLLDIEMQSYAYYNKGSLAMFSVMDLLGEAKMNRFLGEFVAANRFRERPYPTSHDFYRMLLPYLGPGQKELADDQLHRITLYRNKMVSAKGKKLPSGMYEVRMKVELGKMYVDSVGGNEKQVPFAGSVYVGLLNEEKPKKKGDVLRLEKAVLKTGQELVWQTRQKPKYASLDPLHTLTEILPEDNTVLIDWE